jgi:hypothetical protein
MISGLLEGDVFDRRRAAVLAYFLPSYSKGAMRVHHGAPKIAHWSCC